MLFLEDAPQRKISKGPAATASEMYSANRDDQLYANGSIMKSRAVRKGWEDKLASIKKVTGQHFEIPTYDGVFMPQFGGLNDEEMQKYKERAAGEYIRITQQIQELAKQHPEHAEKWLLPPEFAGHAASRAADKRLKDVSSRNQSWLNSAAGFAGAFVGGMQDPINLGLAPFGAGKAVGKGAYNVLRAGMVNGLIGAAGEAAIQPMSQKWRQEAGLKYGLGEAAKNVGMAFAFGFGIDAGFRGAYRGGKILKGKIDGKPSQAQADAFYSGLKGLDEAGSEAQVHDIIEQAASHLPANNPLHKALIGKDYKSLVEAVRIVDPERAEGLAQSRGDLGHDRADIVDDELRGAAHWLEGEDGRAEPAGLHHGDDAAAESQTARHLIDQDEPPAVMPKQQPEQGISLQDGAVKPLADTGTIDSKTYSSQKVRPSNIETDAQAFQFKEGGDAAGVTQRLEGVKNWNPMASGKAIIFQRKNGALIIADGHQRLGLAKRLEQQDDIKLDAFIFKESDGWTPPQVRALAAKKNIQEATGTALDYARIMRDQPTLLDGSVPQNSTKMAHAKGLANLSDDAFGLVVNEIVPANHAALVGRLVADDALHVDILDQMSKADLGSEQQARIFIGQALQSGTHELTQMTLFGTETMKLSLLPARTKILTDALKNFKQNKRLLAAINANAVDVEAVGNTVNKAANEQKSAQSAQMAELIEKLASSHGPVSDALQRAAHAMAHDDISVTKARKIFMDDVDELYQKQGLEGLINPQKIDEPQIEPGSVEAEKQGDLLGQRLAEFPAHTETPDNFQAIVDRLPEPVRAELVDVINLPKDAAQSVDPSAVTATWDRARLLIQVAMHNADPTAKLRHEEIHALRDLELFTDREWKLLLDAGNKAGIMAEKISDDITRQDLYQQAYANRSDLSELIDQEVVAHLAERRKAGEDLGVEVNVILDKLLEFLHKTANALRGMGFQTAEDVFRRIESGEIGRRTQSVQGQDGIAYSLDPETKARYSDANVQQLLIDKLGEQDGKRVWQDILTGRAGEGDKHTHSGNADRRRENGQAESQRAAAKSRVAQTLQQVEGDGQSTGGFSRRDPLYRSILEAEGLGDESQRLARRTEQGFDDHSETTFHYTNMPPEQNLETGVPFKEFRFFKKEFGAHFGDQQAALERQQHKAEEHGSEIGGQIVELRLRYKQPLVLEDIGVWNDPYQWLDVLEVLPENNVKHILKQGEALPSSGQKGQIHDAVSLWLASFQKSEKRKFDYYQEPDRTAFMEAMGKILDEAGFDAVKYPNAAENIGSPSVFVWHSEQIRAAHDTFDPKTAGLDRIEEIADHIRKGGQKDNVAYSLEPRRSQNNNRAKKRLSGVPRRPEISVNGSGSGYGAYSVDDGGSFLDKISSLIGLGQKIVAKYPEKFNNDNFKKWFGQSKIVTKKGDPLIVYHSTNAEFDNFRATPGDLGVHFGGTVAANDRLKARRADAKGADIPYREAEQVIPVVLSIQKPLAMPDVYEWHHPMKVVTWLLQNKKIDKAFYQSILNEDIRLGQLMKSGEAEGRRQTEINNLIIAPEVIKQADMIKLELRRQGYDGIVYTNAVEGRGSKSYIAFDDRQIKGLFNRGTFDPNDQRYMYSIDPEDALKRVREILGEADETLGKGQGKAEDDYDFDAILEQLHLEQQRAHKVRMTDIKAKADINIEKFNAEKQRESAERISIAEAELAEKIAQLEAQKAARKAQKEQSEAQYQEAIARQTAEEQAAKKSEYIEQKRRAVLTLVAAERVKSDMLRHKNAKGQRDIVAAALSHMENYGTAKHSAIAQREKEILGDALAQMQEFALEFERTKITGQTPKAKIGLLNDIIRESFGEKTGNTDAQRMAGAWYETHETMRRRFNRAGGMIGYLKEWGLPQSHNQVAIEQAKFTPWKEFITPLLDREKMRHNITGQPHTDAQFDDMLVHIYQTIVTNGMNTKQPDFAGGGSGGALYKQGSEARFLHFKNADSWLDYAQKFGNISGTHGADLGFHAMMRHLSGFSRDVAAMEILGPNPNAMLNYMRGLIEQQLAMSQLFKNGALPADGKDKQGNPYVKTLLGRKMSHDDYVRKGLKKLEDHFDIVRGVLDSPVDAQIADYGKTIRNWQVATKLGSATLSAIGDIATFKAALKFAGMKNQQLIIKDIFKYIQAEDRHFAVRSGLILDSAMSMVHTETRFGGAVEAATRTGKIADRTLAWSGLSAWTQSIKHAFGMESMANFARVRHLSFDKLDPKMQRLFDNYGLSAKQWDLIRVVKPTEHKGVAFLRGVDMRGDADLMAAKTKYMEIIHAETEYAVPSGTIASQAITKKFQAGTLEGETWRLFFQFKAYPISILMMQGGRTMRLVHGEGAAAGAAYAASTFMAMTLAGGVIGTWLKDLKAGRDPDMDFTSQKNWGRWMAQGGGIGIMGDFLFSDHNRFGGGPLSTFAGPAFGDVERVLRATAGNVQKVIAGKETSLAKDALGIVRSNTPGIGSLWYTATAYNRVLLDQMNFLVDPAASKAFRRRMKKRETEYGQQYFWPLGATSPARAPSGSSLGETFSFQ